MSNIFNAIGNIAESIKNFPKVIGDFFKDTWEILKGIPQGIGDIIKDIFTPKEEEVSKEFNEITTGISSKFGFNNFDINELFQNEKPLEEQTLEYEILGEKISGKILDTSFLIKGINYFRPYIRGFIILMLFFYNVRQIMSIFSLDSGEIKGQTRNSKEKGG